MKNGLYKIYDTVADSFGPMQEAKTLAQAQRLFQNAIREFPQPQDFELWRVGYIEISDERSTPASVRLSTICEVVDLGKDDGDYGQKKLFKETGEPNETEE